MSEILTALTIAAALLVAACGALADRVPSLDTAATAAMQRGACLRLVEAPADLACNLAIWSDAPIQDCRAAVARCERW